MSVAFAIRKAQPHDAAAIAACLAAAFAPFRSQYTAGAFADTVLNAEGVLDRMTRMTIYAATTTIGEIVGTIAAEVIDQVGHLRGMAVRTEWQGQAIAEQLLGVAEDDIRIAGCHPHRTRVGRTCQAWRGGHGNDPHPAATGSSGARRPGTTGWWWWRTARRRRPGRTWRWRWIQH